MKILIAEDDLSLGYLLSEFLEQEGYEVKLCNNGAKAWDAFQSQSYDLCLLDVMMPEMDGFSLAKKIKALSPNTPFLFLTAKSLKDDKLQGFSLGAEDYITKPFDEQVLLCRIQVALRRATPTDSQNQVFEIGNYHFDYQLQELSYQDQKQRLTEKENEVLRLLCLNKNQILKREEAVQQIYGKKDYFLGRSFDVFISKIRKKLKNDPNIEIENVFKVGFILKVSDN